MSSHTSPSLKKGKWKRINLLLLGTLPMFSLPLYLSGIFVILMTPWTLTVLCCRETQTLSKQTKFWTHRMWPTSCLGHFKRGGTAQGDLCIRTAWVGGCISLCHFLAVRPWASCLTALCLCFFACKSTYFTGL